MSTIWDVRGLSCWPSSEDRRFATPWEAGGSDQEPGGRLETHWLNLQNGQGHGHGTAKCLRVTLQLHP